MTDNTTDSDGQDQKQSATTNKFEKTLVHSMLGQHKRDRFWKNFRFFGWIFILIVYAIIIIAPSGMSPSTKATHDYVALLRLSGTILAGQPFSANKVGPDLRRAFADKHAKGVVLVINSPGGSPVQASIIHDKILYLKKLYKKRVIVVGVDALASGAYLVASAADKIYVNRDTLTGSIGVIMSGFGFKQAIQKLGVTRRVFTAGTNKDRLDPFETVTPEDKAKVEVLLKQVHKNFIADVVAGRKGHLPTDTTEIFSGDFWTGEQAVKLGLADGTENLWVVLQKEFKVDHYKDYTSTGSLVQAIFKNIGSELKLGLTEANVPLRAQAY